MYNTYIFVYKLYIFVYFLSFKFCDYHYVKLGVKAEFPKGDFRSGVWKIEKVFLDCEGYMCGCVLRG